jgi:hypothetical protein
VQTRRQFVTRAGSAAAAAILGPTSLASARRAPLAHGGRFAEGVMAGEPPGIVERIAQLLVLRKLPREIFKKHGSDGFVRMRQPEHERVPGAISDLEAV